MLSNLASNSVILPCDKMFKSGISVGFRAAGLRLAMECRDFSRQVFPPYRIWGRVDFLKNLFCLNFLTFSPHPCSGWFDNCPGNPLPPGVWPHSTLSSKSVFDVARGQLQNHGRGQASGAHGPPWGLGAFLPRASSLHRASAGSALLPHRAGVRSKRDHRSGVPVSPAGVGGP